MIECDIHTEHLLTIFTVTDALSKIKEPTTKQLGDSKII